MDLSHIPFTDYEIIGKIHGVPILAIYYIIFGVYLVYMVVMYFYTKTTYGKYLYDRFGIILIGGKFNSGKTRLLSQFASDVSVRKNTFVISNFYNAYSFCSFSSFSDFVLILDDLLLLGEYQNFSGEDLKNIKNKFGDYFTAEDRKEVSKYKYIPKEGKDVCNFVIMGDEFHQYLYGRNAMGNFAGEEGKKLLQTLHQVRHYNSLIILATQDIDELDIKLRSLASYEIDTRHFLNLFFGYDFFRYILNRRKTKDNEESRQFKKVNKFPILFFNSFAVNFVIEDCERLVNRLYKFCIQKWNKEFGKNVIFRELKFGRFKTLDFQTKFNVKLTKSIYKKGDLFVKLNDFYKKIGQ